FITAGAHTRDGTNLGKKKNISNSSLTWFILHLVSFSLVCCSSPYCRPKPPFHRCRGTCTLQSSHSWISLDSCALKTAASFTVSIYFLLFLYIKPATLSSFKSQLKTFLFCCLPLNHIKV
uniref:Uncharacterized protein n=1 Tax=Myripristis murdjan TaxID=586833 RepID=A0A667X4X4_9TELE